MKNEPQKKEITVGEKVPDWTFVSTDPFLNSFKDLMGHNIVLYFYPKDDTPDCTLQGKSFTDLHEQFEKYNTKIVGVSRDTLACHRKFSAKYAFSFALVTDREDKLCNYFNVINEQNILLEKSSEIERSTFLIDKDGIIKRIWREVKVKGHAQEVLEAVKSL